MIYKTASPQPGYVRVRFELPSFLWANHVAIVGDFNGWRTDATPMHQERDGVWRVTLDLPEGNKYEFRYLVDGMWMTDYHADGFVTSAYGTDNSVIIVELPEEVLTESRHDSQVDNGGDQIPYRPLQPAH